MSSLGVIGLKRAPRECQEVSPAENYVHLIFSTLFDSFTAFNFTTSTSQICVSSQCSWTERGLGCVSKRNLRSKDSLGVLWFYCGMPSQNSAVALIWGISFAQTCTKLEPQRHSCLACIACHGCRDCHTCAVPHLPRRNGRSPMDNTNTKTIQLST